MTLVLKTPNTWGVQNVQLGLNELAASLAVSKYCGSVFTRREYSNLFDVAEASFDLRMRDLPPWLQNIHFDRSCMIHGERMRPIKVPSIMDDVDKFKLSGVAVFVTLCTSIVEDNSSIMKMLTLLVLGGLGNVVKTDSNRPPDIPYQFKPHMIKFVESCKESDRESEQSRKALTWMAELGVFGDLGWGSKDTSIRRQQASIDLMAEILGGTTREEEIAKATHRRMSQTPSSQQWARVHDTLHLSSAYIALAAAANGADIFVECVGSKGSKFFPRTPSPTPKKSSFLVRLWLIQPPEEVRGILRYSASNDTATYMDNEEERQSGTSDDENLTIFGGTREIAIWVARMLKFEYKGDMPNMNNEMAHATLWSQGAKIVSNCRWRVRRDPWKNRPLHFDFRYEKPLEVSGSAAQLSNALQKSDSRLGTIARPIAAAVDELYRLDDYSFVNDVDEPDIFMAMQFLLVAVAIESLRKMTYSQSGATDQYALSLSTLEQHHGALRELIPQAVVSGITLEKLVWTASTVWGGASLSSSGSVQVDQSVIGVVAPQCTVILDFIRDPLLLVRQGETAKILSVWRGAVPMLPRDPKNGFCRSPTKALQRATELTPEFELSEYPAGARIDGKMIITFEPLVSDTTVGAFCCWYSRNLTCEISPITVFSNLLKRPSNGLPISHKEQKLMTRIISQMDLLMLKEFLPTKDMVVLIDGLEDPAWAFFAAGCCPTATIVHRGNVEDMETRGIKRRLSSQDVVLVIPEAKDVRSP